MSILNQNLLTLDFWQDKVTYGKQTVPIGTIGCAALNITDEQITELITLCQPLTEVILMLGTGNVDVSVFPVAEKSLLKIICFLQKTEPFSFLDLATDEKELHRLFDEEYIENIVSYIKALQEPGAALMMGSVDLGSGVTVTEMLSYTGAFMEDRSDEVVTGVLAIRVTNHGGEAVQLMDIVLTDGVVNATFSLSTLMPGDTVIVLEKDRMLYKDAPVFTDSYPASVAIFQDVPGKCEDQLEIQCLNGILNVTNISGEDIAGDIVIYYKNQIQGIYYGGITYRLRIEGGLKAGEIRQGMAAHFNPTNSTVVFVTCG